MFYASKMMVFAILVSVVPLAIYAMCCGDDACTKEMKCSGRCIIDMTEKGDRTYGCVEDKNSDKWEWDDTDSSKWWYSKKRNVCHYWCSNNLCNKYKAPTKDDCGGKFSPQTVPAPVAPAPPASSSFKCCTNGDCTTHHDCTTRCYDKIVRGTVTRVRDCEPKIYDMCSDKVCTINTWKDDGTTDCIYVCNTEKCNNANGKTCPAPTPAPTPAPATEHWCYAGSEGDRCKETAYTEVAKSYCGSNVPTKENRYCYKQIKTMNSTTCTSYSCSVGGNPSWSADNTWTYDNSGYQYRHERCEGELCHKPLTADAVAKWIGFQHLLSMALLMI